MDLMGESMRYWTAGPFDLDPDQDGYLNMAEYGRRDFWLEVDVPSQGVSEACGCYVFTIRRGSRRPKPWYVGKAEKQNFKREALTQDKIDKYNNALALSKGTPALSFYGRITDRRQQWSPPTSREYRDVRFLEKMLIGQALEVNPRLININETALLRSMVVPGLLNSPQGSPRKSDRALAEIFGY